MALPENLMAKTAILIVIFAACKAAKPDGNCYIQNQALVCQYVDSSHEGLVRENLAEIAAKHPYFGVAFDKSQIGDFPEDIFRDYNITTFGLLYDHQQLASFPCTSLLMNLGSKITHLYLISSSVRSADIEQFKKLPFRESLQYLDLRFNSVESIDADTFAGFPNLQEINLVSNKITRVPSHAFLGLEHLKRINLSKNAMVELEEEAFKGLPSLTHIDLSFSNFSTIPKKVFVNLENLQSLNFKYNKLTTLEKDVFTDEDLPKLSELKLEGNPFICNCNLQWFKRWLTEKGLLTNSGAKCFGIMTFSRFVAVDFCPDVDDDETVEETQNEQKQEAEDDDEDEEEEIEESEDDEETEEDLDADDEDEDDDFGYRNKQEL